MKKIHIHYRILPWLHLDQIKANFSFGGGWPPYNRLVTEYDLVADVTYDDAHIGVIANPKDEYDDIYHRSLIQLVDKESIFIPAEWGSDLPREWSANQGYSDKDRLLCLVANLFNEDERMEWRIEQVRKSVLESPMAVPINVLRNAWAKIKGEEGVKLVELGDLYNVDAPGLYLTMDENVFPYKYFTFGASSFTLRKDDDGSVARIRRNPLTRGVGIKDYTIEVDEEYADEQMILFLIALTDIINNMKEIRKSCYYEDMLPAEIPGPARYMRYD